MIFRQSSGGSKVTTTLAGLSAVGLIHRCTAEHGITIRANTLKEAEATSLHFLQALDVSNIVSLQKWTMLTLTKVVASGMSRFGPMLVDRLPHYAFYDSAPAINRDVPGMDE